MKPTMIPFSGVPGPTTRIVCGDVVGNLSDEYVDVSGNPAVGMIITCEDNDIRFTMGGNITTPTYPPTQGVTGLGHVLYAGQSLYVSSSATVRTFQFINYTNGLDAVIQVTPLFDRS